MKLKSLIKMIVRIILVVAIIFWMGVIFGFSAADGDASRSTSDVITEIVIENFYSEYDSMQTEDKEELWNDISFAVRKTGHFGEYAILAILMSLFLLTFEKFCQNKKMLLVAIVFSFLYAITDEVHQSFVAGRSPKVMDVCIDSAGAVCGTIFVATVSVVVKNCHSRIRRVTDK